MPKRKSASAAVATAAAAQPVVPDAEAVLMDDDAMKEKEEASLVVKTSVEVEKNQNFLLEPTYMKTLLKVSKHFCIVKQFTHSMNIIG